MNEVFSHTKKPIKSWASDIDTNSMGQLENMANLPFIHKHVAVMPDVHYGKGATVGSVIATKKAIIPAAVGVDIGYGMIAQKTSLKACELPDTLCSLRSQLEEAIPVGFSAHIEPVATSKMMTSIQKGIDCLKIPESLKNGKQSPFQQLGTLGGGNHFIELCLDESDYVWIMLHSGSRGIGNKIGRYFIEIAKEDMGRFFIHLPDDDLAYLPEGTQHFKDYWDAVLFAQEYAALNREIMLAAVQGILGRTWDITYAEKAINCHHNYVTLENHFNENCYVTRKGAVRAREGDLGIIPGSMGTKSYIVKGKGNKESFNSCSHGAGRRMSRNEARKIFTVDDHVKATQGVECRKDEDVIDETPMAYKDIDKVMEAQADLVEIKYTLKQILCVKG